MRAPRPRSEQAPRGTERGQCLSSEGRRLVADRFGARYRVRSREANLARLTPKAGRAQSELDIEQEATGNANELLRHLPVLSVNAMPSWVNGITPGTAVAELVAVE